MEVDLCPTPLPMLALGSCAHNCQSCLATMITLGRMIRHREEKNEDFGSNKSLDPFASSVLSIHPVSVSHPWSSLYFICHFCLPWALSSRFWLQHLGFSYGDHLFFLPIWVAQVEWPCFKAPGVNWWLKGILVSPSSLDPTTSHSRGARMNEWPKPSQVKKFPGVLFVRKWSEKQIKKPLLPVGLYLVEQTFETLPVLEKSLPKMKPAQRKAAWPRGRLLWSFELHRWALLCPLISLLVS